MTRKPKKPTQKKRRPHPQQPPAAAPKGLGIGGTIGMVLCLVIPGALLVWLAVTVVDVTMPEVALALGRTGTPGTATVVSCERIDSGEGRSRRTRYDCEAYFVFDDRSREPIVIDTVPDVEVGEVFPAALTPAGDQVLPTGARGAWRAILVFSSLPFGVALIAFLSALIMRSRKAIIWTGALGAPFLIAMIIGIVVGT